MSIFPVGSPFFICTLLLLQLRFFLKVSIHIITVIFLLFCFRHFHLTHKILIILKKTDFFSLEHIYFSFNLEDRAFGSSAIKFSWLYTTNRKRTFQFRISLWSTTMNTVTSKCPYCYPRIRYTVIHTKINFYK